MTQSLLMANIGQFKSNLELPGEVSQELVKRGLDVPFLSILVSLTNFIIIIAIAVTSIATVLWHRKKNICK